MSSFKSPGFQDRISCAAEAKKKGLEQLLSRPPVDQNVAAERPGKRPEREISDRERAAAKKARQLEAKAAKAAETAAKAAAAAPRTEAELKAARDARYAARKARKIAPADHPELYPHCSGRGRPEMPARELP